MVSVRKTSQVHMLKRTASQRGVNTRRQGSGVGGAPWGVSSTETKGIWGLAGHCRAVCWEEVGAGSGQGPGGGWLGLGRGS